MSNGKTSSTPFVDVISELAIKHGRLSASVQLAITYLKNNPDNLGDVLEILESGLKESQLKPDSPSP